jgi:hypothetical protein
MSELRPATKFLGNSFNRQVSHIESEFKEVVDAIYNRNDETRSEEEIAEELVDLQMPCETMLAILGLDEQQRREARLKVIAKNEARGYYKEG